MQRSYENWSDKNWSEGAAQRQAYSGSGARDVDALQESLSLPYAEQYAHRALETFVENLTDGVIRKLTDEDYLEKYLNTKELRRDNQMLAGQVKNLLKEKKRLEQELVDQGKNLGSYKQIAGNLYIKID